MDGYGVLLNVAINLLSWRSTPEISKNMFLGVSVRAVPKKTSCEGKIYSSSLQFGGLGTIKREKAKGDRSRHTAPTPLSLIPGCWDGIFLFTANLTGLETT